MPATNAFAKKLGKRRSGRSTRCEVGTSMTSSQDDTSRIDAAPFPGEVVPPGEAAAIATITADIENVVRNQAKTSPPARRDAHAKPHGCVKAEFRVLDGLPASLRAGVFAEPRTFEAWIRFSNGNGTPQPDSNPDGRGMAIKLMGVAGSPSTTQDFLMINNPAFFVRNAADYVAFQSASNPIWFFFPSFNPFRFRLHEGWVALSIALQKVQNPLNIRYWSMTPYALGGVAIKFSARPTGAPSPFVETNTTNFLHDNLVKHLATREALFDFLVQPRTRPEAMPIEDPTITWSETAAPFVPVARITIPPQSFDSPEQCTFCENLSFTPFHCLEAHRPLGGINRVRKVVYDAISRLRHDLNHAPRQEPTGFS